MQKVSEAYKGILSTGKYGVETRLLVAGKEFGERRIMSLTVNNSLFANGTISVGGCVSGEIDAVIVAESSEIPRMAMLVPQVRLTYKGRVSEWISKGTYFVDTRSYDRSTGQITLHGYDAMMKAEQLFTNEQINSWGNKSDIAVVNMIANAMGVKLDERTKLGMSYLIPKPMNTKGADSMRKILGYIAAAYGGNWTISFDNRLLLVRIGDIPEETNFLCDELGDYITFGGDRIVL